MKFIYVHLIYLSIIAFLGYNYWSSVQAFKAFEHINSQLKADSIVIINSAFQIRQKLDKILGAYPNPISLHYSGAVQNNSNRADSTINFLGLTKSKFIQMNGGISPYKNDELINSHSTKTSESFFTPTELSQIRDRVTQVSKHQIDSVDHEKDREFLLKYLHLPDLVTNNTFWLLLKKLPASGVAAELSTIQNMIKTDEIAMLNYYLQMNSFCGSFDEFKTVIAPRKAALIEGETFEADIYLAAYLSSPQSGVTIKVNGEPLEINQGVAHFKGKKETIGTKTIKAEAIIRNPLTGMTKTTEGSFEYQVLPKCSRDCQ
jgi:hypothetical protein